MAWWRRPSHSPPRPWSAVLLCACLVAAAGAVAQGQDTVHVVMHGQDTNRTVALTFDDGWDAGRCAEIHDTLVRFDIPATWFPNAVYMGQDPKLWRRIAERDPIANHTTHHVSLPGASDKEVRKELRSDERRIEKLTGRPIQRYLRPPYGAWDERIRRIVGELGYSHIVLWDISAADTSPQATDFSVAKHALRGKPGSIILMHCGPATTARVLPIIIARYACKGFRFATVEQILAGEPGAEAKVSCPPPALPPKEGAATTGKIGRKTPEPTMENTPVADTAALTGEWQLAMARSGDVLDPVAPEVVLTMRFGSGEVIGSLGCEAWAAAVTVGPDGAVAFGDPVRDGTGCADGSAETAAPYLSTLVMSAGQEVVDGALDLVDADGATLLRFAPSPPTSVLGEWQVTGVAVGDQLEGAPDDAVATAEFGPRGRMGVVIGCAVYSGDYQAVEERLVVGSLSAAAGNCPEPDVATVDALLAVLGSVVGWQAGSSSTVDLLDDSGATVLELVPGAIG